MHSNILFALQKWHCNYLHLKLNKYDSPMCAVHVLPCTIVPLSSLAIAFNISKTELLLISIPLQFYTVLLEYFADKKLLRLSQISRKPDPLQSTIAFWQGSCVFTSTNLGFAILLLRIDQSSHMFVYFMFVKHSSNNYGS